MKRNIERWKNTIAGIIKAGIDKREVNPSVDPVEFALYYITVIEGGNFMSKVYDDRTYRAKAIERLKRTIMEELSK